MARPFLLFGKKRGHRHTRSRLLAGAGESLFFLALLILGTAFLVLLLARLVVPEWRANYEFVEHRGVVLAKRIDQLEQDGRLVYRPQARLRYALDGREYDTWTYDIRGAYSPDWEDQQAKLDGIEIGREYKCWYDALNPSRAVIVRGYSFGLWLLLLVPAGFILIGGFGLVYGMWQWGKSPERRVSQGRLADLDLFEEIDALAKSYPAVPHDENITNSPGTYHKYRLPINTSQGWRLFAATLTCLVWNGIVAAFVIIAVGKHMAGQHDWGLDLFIVPFFAVGAFLIYFFVREMLIATGIGPTQIEIEEHPLRPGRTYQLYLSQAGHLSMNSLSVTLECEEQATYRQGTDTRSEARLVHRTQIFSRAAFEIEPGAPFEVECQFSVPALVMHSFKADHNEVQWRIVVCGEAQGWPRFERRFSVVVYPSRRAPAETLDTAPPRERELAI